MKSQEYWAQRQRMLEEARHRKNTKYLKQLDKAFAIERKNIENQILSWYERLADNNGVSLAEAKRMLNAKELKEFHWTVEEYIKYGRENAINQKWMKELENASARVHIEHLRALEINLGQNVERIYHEYGQSVKGLFTGQMKDLYTEASKLSEVDMAFDTRKVKSVLGKPWTGDGKTFSERIWGRKEDLHRYLHTELTRMCVTGEMPERMIKDLAERFNVEKYRAKTLVRTESAYFASTTQKQIYDELGVEKYEILAQIDDRTSDICLNLNSHVFDAKDFEPGVTAPPFHPNCRTITVPWFPEDEEIEDIDETGYNKTSGVYASPIFVSRSELLYEYAKNIKPIPGYVDVVSHADDTSFVFVAGEVEESVSAVDFAKMLENSGLYSGGNIRLIACSSGKGEGIPAQALSDYFGVEVLAPTDDVCVFQTGELIIDNGGEWKKFKPKNGR